MRKTPSWPRSWANPSLFQLYSHRNARANFYILANLTLFSLQVHSVELCSPAGRIVDPYTYAPVDTRLAPSARGIPCVCAPLHPHDRAAPMHRLLTLFCSPDRLGVILTE